MGNASYAWLVGFGYGVVDYSNRGNAFYVRLVRAGQWLRFGYLARRGLRSSINYPGDF